MARLGTNRLDLYLLHRRCGVLLAGTSGAMERLVEAGKILRWGVNNLDTDDVEELVARFGAAGATDHILTTDPARSRARPAGSAHRTQPSTIAYSPVERGRFVAHPGLRTPGEGLGATSAKVALAWLLALDDVIAILSTVRPVAGRSKRRRDALAKVKVGPISHRSCSARQTVIIQATPHSQATLINWDG